MEKSYYLPCVYGSPIVFLLSDSAHQQKNGRNVGVFWFCDGCNKLPTKVLFYMMYFDLLRTTAFLRFVIAWCHESSLLLLYFFSSHQIQTQSGVHSHMFPLSLLFLCVFSDVALPNHRLSSWKRSRRPSQTITSQQTRDSVP